MDKPISRLDENTLPAPEGGKVDVLVIAGEHSGDNHAGRMIQRFRHLHPQAAVCALGGDRLRSAGAQILFDLPEHSVVGLAEVLKNYFFFKRLFEATVDWIKRWQPAVVVLVDYPGFNLRLARRLYSEGLSVKGGGSIALGYYISPQVWAWKSARRFKVADWTDSLAVIFPFEVEVYADTALEVSFVGHPFAQEDYQPPVQYDSSGDVLLLPGSRRSAVARIFPLQLAAFSHICAARPESRASALYASEPLRILMQEAIAAAGLEDKVQLLPAGQQVAQGSCVLTSSGTMSLQVALAGIPGVIVYRAHPLTWWVGSRVVRIPFLGIANILLNRAMYPEFLQQEARPERIARVILDCLDRPQRLQQTRRDSEELKAILSADGKQTAEEWLAKLYQPTTRAIPSSNE